MGVWPATQPFQPVCRITLPNLPAAIAAGLGNITEVSSRVLQAEPIGFELFTIHPDLKCKPYRYSWGVSRQVKEHTYMLAAAQ